MKKEKDAIQRPVDEIVKPFIGKLVVVSHWHDFDLADAVKLGRLQEYRDGYFYIQGDKRGYKHCRPVSVKRLGA